MNESLMRNIVFPLKEKLTGGRTLEHLTVLNRSQWYPPERIVQVIAKHCATRKVNIYE